MSKTKVFINCPFTDNYRNCLDAIVFTLLASGLEPKIAKHPGGTIFRLQKIHELINEADFSIHDISFTTVRPARFNMPFELGLFSGVKGPNKLKEGMILILTNKPYEHQKVISDCLAIDTTAPHNCNPETIIRRVYDWVRHYIQLGTRERKSTLKISSLKTEFKKYKRHRDIKRRTCGRILTLREKQMLMEFYTPDVKTDKLLKMLT